jgi:hypothetical protein
MVCKYPLLSHTFLIRGRIYAVEITPLKLRHISGAVASASGWIWTYCVVQVTQPGIDSIGYKYFIVWAVLCFAWFLIVFCKSTAPHQLLRSPTFLTTPVFYPETKGKTLEELDYIFMKDGAPHHDIALTNKLDGKLATRNEKIGDQTYIEEA